MNFLDIVNGFVGIPTIVRQGVFNPDAIHSVREEPENGATVYTCCKILSDNFSRLPVVVKKDGEVQKGHKISKLFNGKPNSFMNRQQILALAEWERNTFGNSFIEILDNGKLMPIDAGRIINYEVDKNGELKYEIMTAADPRLKSDHFIKSRWIKSSKMLHFKHTGFIMGLSPISAAAADLKLLQNASDTVNSFYRNRAIIPLALESTVADPKQYALVEDERKQFDTKYQGALKSGKTAVLPVNSKLTPLAVHFADAELIGTMKFSRDEICTMFSIPNFLVNEMDSKQKIEDVMLLLKQTTLAPIANIYAQEIAFKMLSDSEIEQGYTVEFDFDNLLEVDFESKVNAYSKATTTGLMSPNQVIKKFGGTPIKEAWGEMHFMQAQYIPLEQYEKYNQLLKDSPNVSKAKKDNKLKSDEE
ncbi:phage portal protein [Carboxylicivirga marina]|uniref:Phage portal protein n=1 Tax=Carboxylicivirga marina TaxID=2800988 RepID=A0ABS1HGC3_9BACT|nr:phage portal protein [Carboxylicivirga marina]MBK3516702.1 phage portal protein [Carboxylicivirga marina]